MPQRFTVDPIQYAWEALHPRVPFPVALGGVGETQSWVYWHGRGRPGMQKPSQAKQHEWHRQRRLNGLLAQMRQQQRRSRVLEGV